MFWTQQEIPLSTSSAGDAITGRIWKQEIIALFDQLALRAMLNRESADYADYTEAGSKLE
jgi:hypothetical protein